MSNFPSSVSLFYKSYTRFVCLNAENNHSFDLLPIHVWEDDTHKIIISDSIAVYSDIAENQHI